jgi:hypothetical protein
MSSSNNTKPSKLEKIIKKFQDNISDKTSSKTIYNVAYELKWKILQLSDKEKIKYLTYLNGDKISIIEKKLSPTNVDMFIESKNKEFCSWIVENTKIDNKTQLDDFVDDNSELYEDDLKYFNHLDCYIKEYFPEMNNIIKTKEYEELPIEKKLHKLVEFLNDFTKFKLDLVTKWKKM